MVSSHIQPPKISKQYFDMKYWINKCSQIFKHRPHSLWHYGWCTPFC